MLFKMVANQTEWSRLDPAVIKYLVSDKCTFLRADKCAFLRADKCPFPRAVKC